MRKGFIVTLGVVALVLAVSPGFAVAPIISCIPDIIVSDIEDNTQTDDVNFFVFSNALDLDEYVQDSDTTDVTTLRWSFIETSGNAIMINGILSDPGVNIVEPGASNIRSGTGEITVQNVAWTTGAPPWADPGAASMQSTVELYVSDGTNTDSTTIMIETVNDSTGPYNDGTADGLRLATVRSWPFDTGDEGFGWFDGAPVFIAPAHGHNAATGALDMTESMPHSSIVFGAYESPQNPALAAKPSLGCILRARYTMRSDPDSALCPGFRMRAIPTHVVDSGGGVWIPAFDNQDFNADFQVLYSTLDLFYLAGRAPGAGQVYTVLSYPVQVSTLGDADMVTYFTCDLLDTDAVGAIGNTDAGTLSLDGLVIDAMDSPAAGSGAAVPELTSSNFLADGWTGTFGVIDMVQGNTAGMNVSIGQTISIIVASGNQWFDAYAESTGAALTAGDYYRATFMVTSTEQDTGEFGPTVRASFISTAFVYSADHQIGGGGLLANFRSTAKPFEVWIQAPTEDPSTPGLTEPMKLKFESWLTNSNTGWPFLQNVSGTIGLESVTTERFTAP